MFKKWQATSSYCVIQSGIMKKRIKSNGNSCGIKKIALIMSILILSVFTIAFSVSAEEPIYVSQNTIGIRFNGAYVATDNFVFDGVTYIPIKNLAEILGVDVNYDEDTINISVTDEITAASPAEFFPEYKPATTINVVRNEITINFEGEKIDMDNFVFNETAYAPLRAVAELLGCIVSYDEETNSARIYSKDYITFTDNIALIYGYDKKTVTKDEFLDVANIIYQGQLTAAQQLEFSHIADLFFNKLALEGLCEKLNIEINEEDFKDFLISQNCEAAIDSLPVVISNREALFENMVKADYIYSVINQADLTKAYIPSDEELILEFAKSRMSQGHWMQVKHILILDDGTENAEEKALKLLAEIKDGADFDTLMFENTEDPGIEQYPDGYIFTDGEMVEEFHLGSLELDVNELGIVKTDYGYHIIKKIADYKNGMPFLEIKQSLLENYANNAIQNDFAGMRIYNDVVLNKSLILEPIFIEKE